MIPQVRGRPLGALFLVLAAGFAAIAVFGGAGRRGAWVIAVAARRSRSGWASLPTGRSARHRILS